MNQSDQERKDRDVLIRVEQQLKDSVENQKLILDNQREIFSKAEKESKQLTVLSGDVKAHMESTKVRWTELEKTLSTLNKRLDSAEEKLDENEEDINQEREERIKDVNQESADRKSEAAALNLDNKTFKESVTSSIKTIKLIATILTGIAALAAIFQIAIQLLGK